MKPLAIIHDKLAKYPDVKIESDDRSITVLPNSPTGFSVTFVDYATEFIVSLGGWHDHFDNASDGLDIFFTALTSHARLVVSTRGKTEHKWTLELLEDGEWTHHSTDGLLFFPFWRRPTSSYQQNDIIPHPDASPKT